MIKAVFFDIDGTLMSFKTHAIPASTVKAIKQLKEKGIRIFIATGRAPLHIPQFDELQFDGYITLNGVYCITNTGEIVVDRPIPKSDIEAVIRYQKEMEPFPCAFTTEKEIIINYVNEKVEMLAQLVNIPVPKVKDLHKAAQENIYQINVYVEQEKEAELMRNVFVNCESSRWSSIFTDINIYGYNKKTGIDSFLEYYGLKLEETMAFGDGGNDIAMLQHAGIGVAMENASDEVKACADYVTNSVDNDGIWNALVHFGIIELSSTENGLQSQVQHCVTSVI